MKAERCDNCLKFVKDLKYHVEIVSYNYDRRRTNQYGGRDRKTTAWLQMDLCKTCAREHDEVFKPRMKDMKRAVDTWFISLEDK